MLEVSDLSRKYGDLIAVDHVSFHVEKGEIIGLLGHNGAGKTTIMKIISGYLEPDTGSVKLDGISLNENPKAIQQQLGYLPESLPVYPEMSVADYLDYAADLKGLSGTYKTEEIKRVIKATDIGSKLLAPIATLSRGFKQRVGVAQAILGQPKLLILDEPTNGLDPDQTQHMRDLIRQLAKEATVILSTHIMQEVEALCSRVLIVRAGKLAVDAQLADLRNSNAILLETSLPVEKSDDLRNISGVSEVTRLSEIEQETQLYRIEIDSQAQRHHVSAAIANKVIDMNQKLYRLEFEQRDLETLFREVNEDRYQQEGLSHAA
jgi:ABC-2 type transport system ATP-binding protein